MKVLVISFQSLNQESAGGTGRIAYYVAKELSRKGQLTQLVVSSKGKYQTPFPCVPVSPLSRYYLFLLNRILRPLGLQSHVQRYLEELLFDLFCKNHVTRDVDLIFSTNAYLTRTLQKAKKLNIKTVFFPGNPSENLISALMARQYAKLGVQFTDAYNYKPRFTAYNKSLNLFSTFIYRNSLIKESFKGNYPSAAGSFVKGFVPPLKLEANTLHPGAASSFAVGYLAYSVPLKGLHYLMEAWEKAALENANLYIGGPIDAKYKRYLDSRFPHLRNVKYTGLVSEKSAFYKQLSLFVAPSVIDGEPVTVLEAMQFGVPAVVTEACGVKDFIQHGEDGFIIPSEDPSRLCEVIKWCYQNQDKTRGIGQRASVAVRAFSFDDFISQITLKLSEL